MRQTGGWGSLEYGTPVKGQVIGGRWKPLHYFLKKSVYADVMATCDGSGLCYVKNDVARPFSGTVVVERVDFADGGATEVKSLSVDLAAGAGVTEWFNADIGSIDGTKSVVVITVTEHGTGTVASENVLALSIPQHMAVERATISFKVGAVNSDGNVDISVTTDKLAMYVVFTTEAAGRFSDNAFLLRPGTSSLEFVPFGKPDVALLKESLRVEDLSAYV